MTDKNTLPKETNKTNQQAFNVGVDADVIPECICKGNFRTIVAETFHLFGKKFKDGNGKEYTYFGVVYGEDDIYYGMADKDNKCVLLSCVGNINMFGFTEV